MKVKWTATAQKHLDSIYAHIAQDSAAYALKLIDRITDKSRQIAEFPQSGRRVPEYEAEQTREVYVALFRIIYHIRPDGIDVLAVIHGSMDISLPGETAE